jgi:hypothetical protein
MRHNPPRKPGRKQTLQEKTNVCIVLDSWQLELLKTKAKEEQRSVSQVIRMQLFPAVKK